MLRPRLDQSTRAILSRFMLPSPAGLGGLEANGGAMLRDSLERFAALQFL